MLKKLLYFIGLLLLCTSCVSRTTIKEPGLKGEASKSETKLIWIWDKEF